MLIDSGYLKPLEQVSPLASFTMFKVAEAIGVRGITFPKLPTQPK
jgi:hypothetical protein